MKNYESIPPERELEYLENAAAAASDAHESYLRHEVAENIIAVNFAPEMIEDLEEYLENPVTTGAERHLAITSKIDEKLLKSVADQNRLSLFDRSAVNYHFDPNAIQNYLKRLPKPPTPPEEL